MKLITNGCVSHVHTRTHITRSITHHRQTHTLQTQQQALKNLVQKFIDEGDVVRAEHVQGVLAAEDVPLCKQEKVFMGLTNNPSEQVNKEMKHNPGAKRGMRLSLFQWTNKILKINETQSARPKIEEKVQLCTC